MKVLLEDNTLYKGIFWIKDTNDYDSKLNEFTYFQIPVDSEGNIADEFDKIRLNSRNNDNYNHEQVWNSLNVKSITNNKKFNYYPRGRVEIRNGKAIIYCNPNICNDQLKDWIIDKFNLNSSNNIKKIVMIPDYSDHYKCHLDNL